jgi:cytochrome c-type biogenesis protein CcmH
VQRLADRLKENPNDLNGWLRLAQAYDVLGEKEKAREARAKAKSLSQK